MLDPLKKLLGVKLRCTSCVLQQGGDSRHRFNDAGRQASEDYAAGNGGRDAEASAVEGDNGLEQGHCSVAECPVGVSDEGDKDLCGRQRVLAVASFTLS